MTAYLLKYIITKKCSKEVKFHGIAFSWEGSGLGEVQLVYCHMNL